MKKFVSLLLSSITCLSSGSLVACGDRAQMEACTLVEIEDAEFEVDRGDIDIERGEVEMVCGDKLIDVTWGQFRQKLNIDPGKYKQSLEGFKSQVSCFRNESSRKKEVFCNRSGSSQDFVPLDFSYDD